MAASQLELDTLSKAFAVCKQLLLDIQPKLEGLREIYDSVGGVKATLTQEDMDAIPELSGLAKAQLDDGLFVLTTILVPALENGYPSLAKLAARLL